MDKRIAAAEVKVDECEKHRAGDQQLIAKMMFEIRRDHIAVRILFGALRRVDPRNAALGNVADLLRQSFDPQVGTPDEFTALLAELGDVE